jgi:serine protease Do
MIRQLSLLAPFCIGVLCWLPGQAQPQDGKSLESTDRITPIVRVVQKCQGSVVAFMNLETGKPMGTGVIVDKSGLIVTNAHVVGKSKKLKLQLIDKTELEAEVLKVVGDNDLALVKITTTHKLDHLPPCKSDKVYVGEEVIAIGHPYGYSYSISRGILSATERKIPLPSGNELTGVYQTDAAINPGNSGGPLMNIAGELIGINFAVREDAQNIAFTIPAKKVRELMAAAN